MVVNDSEMKMKEITITKPKRPNHNGGGHVVLKKNNHHVVKKEIIAWKCLKQWHLKES
eukprot:UN03770